MMSTNTTDAQTILSNAPGSFAWTVLTQRHPALIGQVAAAHPYPPETRHRLDALRNQIAGSIRALPDLAAGKSQWDRWGAGVYGRQWLDVPFLWAESYFYRLLLEEIGYFTPGPWCGIDPFVQKHIELADPALEDELTGLPDRPAAGLEQHTADLIHKALWGNRADLGFHLSNPAAADAPTVDIIADHTTPAVEHLHAHSTGTLCLVADNAGRELIPDLLLLDHLLQLHPELTVQLHLKPYPYYVSDATTTDLLATLNRLRGIPGPANATAEHLTSALRSGRLILRTPEFYCAPLPFHDMPADLRAEFAQADTVIMKGDLNYRRLVGDRHWHPTTRFDALVGYFPSTVIALRTLKSDVAAGIDATIVTGLDSIEPNWRTSGQHAVVHIAKR
ncbi:damage-control phosphatase ARMT1 family protein [Nocardia cyriacigeorgica]|nr:damage-control phosphatase ARMT1 family protein [Nocardia cyriacigeorgica]